jgi:hypothetical protein
MGYLRANRGPIRRRRAFHAAGLAMVSVTALLLWSRLKLVTNTPRTVYADPDGPEADSRREPVSGGGVPTDVGGSAPHGVR